MLACLIYLHLALAAVLPSGTLIPTSDFDPISIETAALFAGSPYCDQIYSNQEYQCGQPCSGLANNTVLVTTAESARFTSRGLIAYSKPLHTVFVVFRGTQSFKELEQFLKVRLQEPDWNAKNWIGELGQSESKIKVHSGYEEIYYTLRSTIQLKLQEISREHPDANIIFIGYSLGAALATMAAVDFEMSQGLSSRTSLYTFGSPRLGNHEWAKFVDSLSFSNRYYRIARRGDFVPDVPLQSLGYEHSGQPYYFDKNGSTVVEKCPVKLGSNESPECISSAFPSVSLHFRGNSYFGMGMGC